MPGYVEDELRGYLECGLLCFGFARAVCMTCRTGFVVAFPCKGRGVCPSCNGRHMAQTAAHLSRRRRSRQGGCCDANPNQKPRSHDTSRIAWAKLMARVGEEFPLAPARGPPTDWGELVQMHDERNVFQATGAWCFLGTGFGWLQRPISLLKSGPAAGRSLRKCH